MVKIIEQYIKYCFITALIVICGFLIFTPLNVVLPEFPLQFIDGWYQQFSVWDIVTRIHLELTSLIMILALIVLGVRLIWMEL